MASEGLLTSIFALPKDWHTAGSLHNKVLQAIYRLPQPRCSMETGTGRSTLLLSHISKRHLVFCHEHENRTLEIVRSSPLLGANAEFIVGPTQVTLPKYEFVEPLDLALLDGPHGYPFPELEYYYVYQHLRPGGFLVVDDIQIPTVTRLFEFLREDDMFELDKIIRTTAFFRRTNASTFNPLADDWWLQNFNTKRNPDLRYAKFGIVSYLSHHFPKLAGWARKRIA